MDDSVRNYHSKIGKKGGAATKKKYGKKHFSEAGRKSVEARRAKKRAKELEDKKSQ